MHDLLIEKALQKLLCLIQLEAGQGQQLGTALLFRQTAQDVQLVRMLLAVEGQHDQG